MSITKSLLKSSTKRRAVSLLGRLGYGARGASYLAVGISAGLATFSRDYRPGGVVESLKPLQHHWLGATLIMLLAAGLACFCRLARHDRDPADTIIRGPRMHILMVGTLRDAAIYIRVRGCRGRSRGGAARRGSSDAVVGQLGSPAMVAAGC